MRLRRRDCGRILLIVEVNRYDVHRKHTKVFETLVLVETQQPWREKARSAKKSVGPTKVYSKKLAERIALVQTYANTRGNASAT